MEFKILEPSGITQSELAFMCKVSRQTTNSWIKQISQPRPVQMPVINRVLKAIALAVDEGALPVPENEPRTRVRKVLNVRPAAISAMLKFMR